MYILMGKIQNRSNTLLERRMEKKLKYDIEQKEDNITFAKMCNQSSTRI